MGTSDVGIADGCCAPESRSRRESPSIAIVRLIRAIVLPKRFENDDIYTYQINDHRRVFSMFKPDFARLNPEIHIN